MLPRNRRPTLPGEILRYEFFEPLGLTQKELAAALGITRVRLSEIIRGKHAITPDTALRLAQFLIPRRNSGSVYKRISICGTPYRLTGRNTRRSSPGGRRTCRSRADRKALRLSFPSLTWERGGKRLILLCHWFHPYFHFLT